MDNTKKRRAMRLKKRLKIRSKISGTGQRPRLAVSRSLKHIYVQAIDDLQGITLASCNSLGFQSSNKKCHTSREVGEKLGKALVERGITSAVFDRGGYLYHGRVKELAEGLRASGLQF